MYGGMAHIIVPRKGERAVIMSAFSLATGSQLCCITVNNSNLTSKWIYEHISDDRTGEVISIFCKLKMDRGESTYGEMDWLAAAKVPAKNLKVAIAP